MKNITLIIITSFFTLSHVYTQNNINLGAGYFGHTITHPGIVLEAEMEKMFSDRVALPIRLNAGFYVHPRNHNGLFLDLNIGFRRYYKSGWFLEESIGVGILETILNADGAFEVDEDGKVSEAPSFNEPDFMPSITLGVGYNLTNNNGKQNLIWFRPKIFWQFPHKTSSTFHPTLQVGFTHNLSKQFDSKDL